MCVCVCVCVCEAPDALFPNFFFSDTYTLQDYSYMYEMSVSGSLSHSGVNKLASNVNSISPPKYQSMAEDNKNKMLESVPPKLPQKAEDNIAKNKLTGHKNLQGTNRTIHEEKTNVGKGGDKNPESSEDIPTIFGVTPTYKRSTQKVDLTSLCQTLMLVPRVMWIVVEDATEKSDLVKKFLQRCKVESVHMNVKTPPKQRSRGVMQRNAGLNWIRQHCMEYKCNGVVYFMDDDNKYDLRLFEEVREGEGGGHYT